MTDRPITFSGPMVRAILDGRKTQHRIALNPQPQAFTPSVIDIGIPHQDEETGEWGQIETIWSSPSFDSPRGEPMREEWVPLRLRFAPGDRLWVKEKFNVFTFSKDGECAWPVTRVPSKEYFDEVNDEAVRGTWDIHYEASPVNKFWVGEKRWLSPKFCPRWASRLTLIVESVKVERLAEISEEDALAEGIVQSKVSFEYDEGNGQFVKEKDWFSVPGIPDPGCGTSATDMFETLWETINGVESLHANPYVCAITFRAIHANIDSEEAKAASAS